VAKAASQVGSGPRAHGVLGFGFQAAWRRTTLPLVLGREGLGFRVQGLGFRVSGSGRVLGLGFSSSDFDVSS